MKPITRNVSLDLVRSFAIFSVIGVHFFLNSGYYNHTVTGVPMFIMTFIRSFFMVCVPLFIILSGYLMKNKKLELKYYKGIIKTLAIYLLAGGLCYIYMCLSGSLTFSIIDFAKLLLNYSAAPYGWYVEMYIGLFLLIPFFNLSYNSLNGQKQKIVLIATMFVVTNLPTLINLKGQIIPDFWVGMYPLSYYFIGCYLREYPIKLPKYILLLAMFGSTTMLAVSTYFLSYGNNFVWNSLSNWNSVFVMAQTVCLFILLKDVNIAQESKSGKFFGRILFYISEFSFGAYLLSYIFDDIVYKKILAVNIPNIADRFPLILLTVPIVFICSILLSCVLNLVYDFVYKYIEKWVLSLLSKKVN